MTADERLDYIIKRLDQLIKRLDQLCFALNPYPGYYQSPDGIWRNRATGETRWDEQQRNLNAMTEDSE